MMPRLENLRGLGDFATLYQWDIQFISLPAGVVGDPERLNFRCESSEIPQSTNQSIPVQIRGHKVKQPGIQEYNGVLNLTFIETVDSYVSRFLASWREICWQTETGVQFPKADVEGSILLTRLNRQHTPIWSYRLIGVYLEDAQLGTLDGSSSDTFKPSLVFSYDYFIDNGATL